jgi:putative ubiquitin-RnfH superfamily antitoxin RatB of RatAB toxin-antitoxin module
MSSFSKSPTARAPFGKNQYLASTQDVKSTSYTFAKAAIPTETIDGETQKVLQPGTVLAVITSVGADQGKVGVYDTTAADGRQTVGNIVGICDTFLPWQLLERDVEVAVVYEAAVKYAWCFQYTAGVRAALGTTVRDAILASTTLSILFK